MNSVFLLSPGPDPLGRGINALWKARLKSTQVSENRIRVDADDKHVFVFLEEDPAELPAQPGAPDSKPALVVEFSSLRLLRRILEALSDDLSSCVVDNDHGFVAGIKDFLARMDADPAWDWRRPE